MKKILFLLLILFLSSVSIDVVNSADIDNYSYSTPRTYKYVADPDKTQENLLFIIDFSNSMNERMGHKTKLDHALATLKEILPSIPENIQVGLRVYGHKTGFTPRQSCTASQLVVPLQANNAANIYAKLNSLNAVGWTPITYSLKQAAFSDFPDTTTQKRIVLISDGGENCDESPCDFVIELMKHREDIKIDVIALAVGDKDANNQLKCVALVTSGRFYNANDADGLKESLQDTLNLQKEVQGVIIQK